MSPRVVPLLLCTLVSLHYFRDVFAEDSGGEIFFECWYIEDGSPLSLGLAAGFSRTRSLLLLRDSSWSEGDSPGGKDSYKIEDEMIIFEADASDIPIPYAGSWRDSGCEEGGSRCEIGEVRSQDEISSPQFLASLSLSHLGIGMTLLLKSRKIPAGNGNVFSPKFQLFLTESGAVPLKVDFLIHTRTSEVRSRLGRQVILHCGQAGLGEEHFLVEWRIQHQGSGRRILTWEPGQESSETEGVSLERGGQGEFSLRLEAVSVRDEGSYICTIGAERGKLQQISHLLIEEPPTVRIFRGEKRKWICEASGFYPPSLDLSWSYTLKGEGGEGEGEGDGEGDETPLASPVVLSGMFQERSGTFTLRGETGGGAGEEERVYVCSVQHVSLPETLALTASDGRLTDAKKDFSTIFYQGIFLIILLIIPVICILKRQ